MQARATFVNQSSIGTFMVLFAAVVAALILGGAGGYVVRALTFPSSAAATAVTHRPFVVEQAPYITPADTGSCHWFGTPPQKAC